MRTNHLAKNKNIRRAITLKTLPSTLPRLQLVYERTFKRRLIIQYNVYMCILRVLQTIMYIMGSRAVQFSVFFIGARCRR